MKKLIVALILSISVATPAYLLAKDPHLVACTSDNVKVQSAADIDDNVPAGTEAHIKSAYVEAAKASTFDQFASGDGFKLFASKLTDEDKEALNFVGQSINVGVCGE